MKLLNFVVKSESGKETYFCFMKPVLVQISSFLMSLPVAIRNWIADPRSTFSNYSIPENISRITAVLLFFVICSSTGFAQTDSLYHIKDSAVVETVPNNLTNGTKTFSSKPYYTLSAQQKKQRQLLVSGINVAAYGGSLFVLNRTWYRNEARTSFQTFNDSKEWLQIDKAGHGWTAYNAGRAATMLWEWAGMPHKKAVWLGGLSGFIYLTGIEFLDAHSEKWGWSWADIGSNIVGSSLFMAQEFLWNEQRIQYKFSFHKNKYREPMLEERADELFGNGVYERMLKDYNAQTYWFSFNLRSFMPESNLPPWLNIAVGYGGDGMFGGFQNKWKNEAGNEITRYDIFRKRQFYVSPDIDFTKIKTKSKFLKTSFALLNAFKCPAPALMIDSKGKLKAYALYF
jgi:hypothetical protein